MIMPYLCGKVTRARGRTGGASGDEERSTERQRVSSCLSCDRSVLRGSCAVRDGSKISLWPEVPGRRREGHARERRRRDAPDGGAKGGQNERERRDAGQRRPLYGSVRTMLCKQDIINLVSVMESLVCEAACGISAACQHCNAVKLLNISLK